MYYVPWDEVEEAKDSRDNVSSENSKKLFACFRQEGDRVLYEYDFGDGQEHQVEMLGMVEMEDRLYPYCSEAQGLRPHEDGRAVEPARTLAEINAQLAGERGGGRGRGR